ncbi:MAG: hypothetical protein ACI9UV_003194 [Algoriphagus sp.]|jgi:hypothetical protein
MRSGFFLLLSLSQEISASLKSIESFDKQFFNFRLLWISNTYLIFFQTEHQKDFNLSNCYFIEIIYKDL